MVLASSPGATRGLNIRTHFYVGGVDADIVSFILDDVEGVDNLDNDIDDDDDGGDNIANIDTDDCEEGEGPTRGGGYLGA